MIKRDRMGGSQEVFLLDSETPVSANSELSARNDL